MAKKITKKERFEEIVKLAKELGRADLVEFAQHEITLLDSKKNSKTATANQKANEEYKDTIVKFLNEHQGESFTITDIINGIAQFQELHFTNQKVSALCKQLVDADIIAKISDKKKSLFLAKGE